MRRRLHEKKQPGRCRPGCREFPTSECRRHSMGYGVVVPAKRG
ncbi:hypothetical protein HVPorG_05029 [Roseomonas mucosa]|nr:hypothetical protein HVPorG_05029 [Roseomonas mucosa]